MMRMKNPSHPGAVLDELCLKPNRLSVAGAAKLLKVSRQQLYHVIAGRGGISAEMALRLEQVFGSTADMWLRMQAGYDLAQLRLKGDKPRLRRFKPRPSGAARSRSEAA
jgi:antitoxin HigA-1